MTREIGEPRPKGGDAGHGGNRCRGNSRFRWCRLGLQLFGNSGQRLRSGLAVCFQPIGPLEGQNSSFRAVAEDVIHRTVIEAELLEILNEQGNSRTTLAADKNTVRERIGLGNCRRARPHRSVGVVAVDDEFCLIRPALDQAAHALPLPAGDAAWRDCARPVRRFWLDWSRRGARRLQLHRHRDGPAVRGYSNIEGRVLAWLAGEDWKVDAFREFDEGIGPDLYIKSYAETFNVPIFGKKDPRRQIGKVMELASGYQGGHGAYLRFGLDDEKKLGELTEIIQAAATDDEWEDSAKKYTLGAHGLSREHWTALRIVIDRWRAKHSNVASFWYEMEEAAINAVRQPGVVQKVGTGKIAFKMAGTILHMRLPSGRCLRYPYPEIREFEVPWKDADGNPATKAGLTYKTEPDVSKKARIVDDPTNSAKFARIKTYGGALVENATQAVARDVLAYAMPRLEAAGYPIVLSVHDELVCEVPDGFGSIEEMEKIMCELPGWAAGLPIAAEGFDSPRYRK